MGILGGFGELTGVILGFPGGSGGCIWAGRELISGNNSGSVGISEGGWIGRAENEEKERRHEVDLEGVGEAGEEIESDEIGDEERGEEREGGVRPEIAGFQAVKLALKEVFALELGRRDRAGGSTVDEPLREERSEKSENEHKMDQEESNKAGFEEEGEGFILDDFFRGADLVGEGFIHGDAGATEPGAEDKGSGILESSGKGGSVEVKANVSGFGDVAIEIGSSLVSVMDEVIDGFTNGFVGVFEVGLELIEVVVKIVDDIVGDGIFWGLRGFGGCWGGLGCRALRSFRGFCVFGEGAEVDEAEGKLVDGFGDGGGESF